MKWYKSVLSVCLSIMLLTACNTNSEVIASSSNAASSQISPTTDASHEASVDFELRTGMDISWPVATYHDASPGFYQINFAEYEKFSFVFPLLDYRNCSSIVAEPPTSYELKAYYIHEGQVTDSYMSFISTAFQSTIRDAYDAFPGDEFELLTSDGVRSFFLKKRTEENRTQILGYPSQGNMTVEINFSSSYYENEEEMLNAILQSYRPYLQSIK